MATTDDVHSGSELAPPRSRRLAILLDDAVTVPGTRIGIGLDAVVGLVPGVGDVAGSAMSAVIISDAVRWRVPVPLLGRMGWNLLVDAGLGVVPFAGDLLDVAHRANRANVRLLEQSIAQGVAGQRPPTFGYLLAAFGLVVLPLVIGLVLGIVALVLLVRWIF